MVVLVYRDKTRSLSNILHARYTFQKFHIEADRSAYGVSYH